MQKRIALLYDFDYTLSPGFMQGFGLAQDLGFDDVYQYFDACDEMLGDKDTDMCLSLLAGTLFFSKAKGKFVSREYLQQYGKNIEYYPGVKEWFDRLTALGSMYGYEVEHYIISSGHKEIIEGTSIAKNFKRIFANFFAYNDNGEAYWPSQVVNYTSKTQYIYRIRKNVLDNLASLEEVNARMEEEEMLPFTNMIYIGDSQTDIPSFRVIKSGGGLSICVYDQGNPKAKIVAMKCYSDGRVNNAVPADYRVGSELYDVITSYMENIMQKSK